MVEKYLVSTNYEFQSLKKKEKELAVHLNESSNSFNFSGDEKNSTKYKKSNNDIYSKNNCEKLTSKIFEELYFNLNMQDKVKISKKAYRIILAPFLNNFIEIIYHKYKVYDQFVSKNKNLNLIVLDQNYFTYFNNFDEFLSFSQKDLFNSQLNSEIVNFNKYINFKRNFRTSFLKNRLKKIKNVLTDSLKFKKNDTILNLSQKKIDQSINIYKLDFRHTYFLKKFIKYKNPIKKNITKDFFKNFNLIQSTQNKELRKKIINNLKSKKRIEQFIFKTTIKYLPSLYFESVINNFELLQNNIKSVPKLLISNAHGWWNDDKFKFYAGFCIQNSTKYIDIQHNGTYFFINRNPHYEISKYFRDYFLGWGESCENQNKNFKLPALYNIKNSIKQKKKNAIDNNKIIYMGASVRRYFGGYFQSYLSGGNSSFYYNLQFNFFKSLPNNIHKNLILRLRHNERDPRGYMSILKKKFNDLNIEDIKISASKRLAKDDIKIIVVDHCSTPWLEALYVNKPLILFWNKSENLINKKYQKIMNSLKKNKIYFECPIAAAKRLEEITKKDIKWWYKEKKIQKLRKELLNLFFYSHSKPVREWNDKIKKIYYGKI